MLPQEKASDDSLNHDILIRVQGKYVFKKGETFDSYEDLLERMDLHTRESLVYYWRRDSRTVERAFTKTSRPIAPRLKYYLVRFACVYGGMKFQTRGAGRRVSQSLRTDCAAHILLRASKCGEKLEVISVCNDHNHEISEKVSQLLPQNRRLPTEVKEEVKITFRCLHAMRDSEIYFQVLEMLRLKIDKKKIIEYVRQRENKKITSKDLFNLASRLKGDSIHEEQEKRSSILQNIYRFTTEKSIKSIVTSELSAYEPDPLVYYPVNNNEIVEFISPEHEFGVNETIIESIVEARKREIEQLEEENREITTTEENYPIKNEIPDDIIIDESDVLERQEMSVDEHSPVIVYEDFISQDGCYYYKSETGQEDLMTSVSYSEQSTAADDSEKLSSNCSVILFETTTDDNIEDGTGKSEPQLLDISEQPVAEDHVITKAKKSFRRLLRCRKCGSNARLVKMQMDYLRAQRAKLLTATKMLELKKKKLKMEIKNLKKTL